eukprot:TRINITY_DN20234_c0_g1_i2.p1 TRINITY_DN20234_c0_g1~~TRINITY_DN20234_c0_g1_i2.p1  ORF type:complete len:204 (+),score=33.99 TRINITY_DN20234_c0_g1_i2:149-760(+)
MAKNAMKGVGHNSTCILAVSVAVSCVFLVITGAMLKECRASNQLPVRSLPAAGDKQNDALLVDYQTAVLHNLSTRIRTAEAALEKLHGIEHNRYRELVNLRKIRNSAEVEPEVTIEDSVVDDSQAPQEQLKLIKFNEATRTFIRWRPDLLCGSRVPLLPDNKPVECDPASIHYCCSNHGWCGSSDEHCFCDGCSSFSAPDRPR